MTLVETLIAKAAEKQGSQAALARELGVHRAQITNWKNGSDRCQPADLAAIAYLAGYNALNVLAAATLKEYEGTQKGEVLNEALGKEIPGLKCLNASGSTPQKSANDQEIQWGITSTYNNVLGWFLGKTVDPKYVTGYKTAHERSKNILDMCSRWVLAHSLGCKT